MNCPYRPYSLAMPRSLWPYLLTLLAAMLTLSCNKGSKSSAVAVEAQAQDLVLSGALTTSDGRPVAGANIFAEDSETPLGTTDAAGTYNLTVGADVLAGLASVNGLPRHAFQLWFELPEQPTMIAVSEAIETRARGKKTLATTTMTQGGQLKGKVLLQPSGRRAEPAAGASIRSGRRGAVSAADGSFQLQGIPSGKVLVQAFFQDYASGRQNLAFAPAENKELSEPVVLFPSKGVAGLVILDAPLELSALTATGQPYLRSFRAYGSPEARYIRYHHDQTSLLSGAAPWRLVPERYEYNFPKDGGHNLYYQFADQGQTGLSEVYSMQVVLDQYAENKGIVIEDGSGLVTRRTVLVHVDVPATAVRMKFFETPETANNAPWLAATSIAPYTFELRRNLETSQWEVQGLRTLYCVFLDATGVQSPAYIATTIVRLFPAMDEAIPFTIDNGATESADRVVRLDIQVPPNAFQMRVFEPTGVSSASFDAAAFGSAGGGLTGSASVSGVGTDRLWLAVTSTYYHVFNSQGMKSLYLQFRTEDGAVSPLYKQVIRILAFVPGDVGFVINDDSGFSDSPLLDITLIPPPNAFQFKLTARPEQVTSAPWRSMVPRTTFLLDSEGQRELFMVFRTQDFDESPVYTQVVTVNAFTPPVGQVVINGGEEITRFRAITLDIAAPANAIKMAVTERLAGPAGDIAPLLTWLDIAPTHDYVLSSGIGGKVMQVYFRNIDGIVSPAVVASVYFDPFPLGDAAIVIDNGAATTSDELVDLSIQIPAAGMLMRLAASPTELSTAAWVEVAGTSTFTLASGLGPYKVYVQFSNKENELSPVYFDSIEKVAP